MTELDRLPPDQRAVLSLVLDRGKSYAEVASMLAIPEATVRDRAHAALDALARAGEPVADKLGASAAGERSTARVAPTPTGARRPPVSAPNPRLRGALLLGGIAIVIVVAVILLTSGGKGSGASTSTSTTTPASSTTTGSSTSTSAAKPRIDKKLTLSAVEPESQAGGEAYVLSDGGRHAFYVAAHGLPPSHGFFYAVWLYNSPSSSAPLGRAPSVGSNGRLEGGGPLPSNASDYAKLIVTHETSTHAHTPGTIVLSGSFSLH
ncbi:MAG TPA: sigma factor-like helix-turn-helix DNA-binding protein [Solirubrobacteraceae bacterium]|nr:sigma factor-like helix-turn-helix DNA-binding protein [Solirubrobacteraceae bacterium]